MNILICIYIIYIYLLISIIFVMLAITREIQGNRNHDNVKDIYEVDMLFISLSIHWRHSEGFPVV